MITTKPVKSLTPTPSGVTMVNIIQTGYGGIIRPAREEPWEAELLLVGSQWNDEKTYKYYLVKLPKKANPRPIGLTMMAKEHMANGMCFETLPEAQKVFNKQCQT